MVQSAHYVPQQVMLEAARAEFSMEKARLEAKVPRHASGLMRCYCEARWRRCGRRRLALLTAPARARCHC